MKLRRKDSPNRFTGQAVAPPRAGCETDPPGPASPLADALEICLRREHLRGTLPIALVVGTILTAINQADVIVAGEASTTTWIKATLNYCVPFVVSNLGLLAGKRAEREPGR
jgi:hypothetical protein